MFTTGYCWRSWTCRIAVPYKYHVDWLIDFLTVCQFNSQSQKMNDVSQLLCDCLLLKIVDTSCYWISAWEWEHCDDWDKVDSITVWIGIMHTILIGAWRRPFTVILWWTCLCNRPYNNEREVQVLFYENHGAYFFPVFFIWSTDVYLFNELLVMVNASRYHEETWLQEQAYF